MVNYWHKIIFGTGETKEISICHLKTSAKKYQTIDSWNLDTVNVIRKGDMVTRLIECGPENAFAI